MQELHIANFSNGVVTESAAESAAESAETSHSIADSKNIRVVPIITV